MRARFRRSHVEDFALDVQLVTRSHGKWPAELVEARTDDAAGGFEVALDQQSHRERGGMPAACRQAAEYRVARRLFVLVERLRIEFRRECLDALLFDGDAPGAVDLSDGEVFEILLAHIGDLLCSTAAVLHGHVSGPNQAPPGTACATSTKESAGRRRLAHVPFRATRLRNPACIVAPARRDLPSVRVQNESRRILRCETCPL